MAKKSNYTPSALSKMASRIEPHIEQFLDTLSEMKSIEQKSIGFRSTNNDKIALRWCAKSAGQLLDILEYAQERKTPPTTKTEVELELDLIMAELVGWSLVAGKAAKAVGHTVYGCKVTTMMDKHIVHDSVGDDHWMTSEQAAYAVMIKNAQGGKK